MSKVREKFNIMTQAVDLTNHFLIAMPGLDDPNFFHTVTYICEHNEEGAMGLMINRPTELILTDVFEQLGIETEHKNSHQLVFQGGPVQLERGFVLHSPDGDWESSMRINDRLALTTSKDILEAMSLGKGPQKAFVSLGYAGWGAGQLEQEMAANTWLSGPADLGIIFDLPIEQRWQAAARALGIDLTLMSNDIGHA